MAEKITFAALGRYSTSQPTFAVYYGFPLLSGKRSQFFHSGTYGWDFAFWVFDGFNIISGFRYSQKKFKKIQRYRNTSGCEEHKKLLTQWSVWVKENYVKGVSK